MPFCQSKPLPPSFSPSQRHFFGLMSALSLPNDLFVVRTLESTCTVLKGETDQLFLTSQWHSDPPPIFPHLLAFLASRKLPPPTPVTTLQTQWFFLLPPGSISNPKLPGEYYMRSPFLKMTGCDPTELTVLSCVSRSARGTSLCFTSPWFGNMFIKSLTH